jgi:hypothetical protein
MNYTSTNLTDSNTYAQMRLSYEKTVNHPDYGTKIGWKEITPLPYYCPPGLECHYGFPVILTENECNARNTFNSSGDWRKGAPGSNPSSKNGWFLSWKKVPEGCYRENHMLKYDCLHNFDSGDIKKGATLEYDNSTHQCNITKAYCDAYGYSTYTDGTAPDYTNRGCSMNFGQTVADTFFGNTVARGVFGGGCF